MDETPLPSPSESRLVIPQGWPEEVYKAVQNGLKAQPNRGIVFERDRQRNAQFIKKGLSKPGAISYETLRRAASSVHVARICINVLKSKITKTPWVIKARDPLAKINEKQKKKVEDLLNYPNQNSETFRTLMDKILEDLLVLDAVSIEKVRYPNGELAELHFVDSATVRPVYDQYGNQDVDIPLDTKDSNGNEQSLPVSYLQILNASQYGGPESGEIIAAWPKRDFIHFHAHPQGSMENFGYGLSPLEGVISVVANLLNADNYNSTYFEEGSFPPIILHIAGQINQRDAETFREYMTQELTGNFHRPAFMAGGDKMEVLDLKSDSNRDMQFMEYTIWLAKLMCGAYGLSPQDIGITDDVNRSTSETMEDLSNQKGYGSILDLVRQVINQQIVWKDFGFEDLEFAWVAQDSMEPDKAVTIYDTSLKNGTMTLNEVREKNGDTPYGDWADEPMILTTEGYKPVMAVPDEQENEEGEDDQMGGEKPFKDQNDGDEQVTKSLRKAVFTPGGYKTWADDRGFSQPFIYMDIKSGTGRVIKPPVAVNLGASVALEEELTATLAKRGLNVLPVVKKTYVEVVDSLRSLPDVLEQFERYCDMTPEYDSEKWRAKFGGSRKFAFYEVVDYIDGYSLSNPLLLADMKRVPQEYAQAARDLKALWEVEKEMVLGDRRADQYIITHDKRAYGIDYQFKGDKDRWARTKDAIPRALDQIPELLKEFEKPLKKSILQKMGLRRI